MSDREEPDSDNSLAFLESLGRQVISFVYSVIRIAWDTGTVSRLTISSAAGDAVSPPVGLDSADGTSG
jgi:hypothetical protein